MATKTAPNVMIASFTLIAKRILDIDDNFSYNFLWDYKIYYSFAANLSTNIKLKKQ